MLTPGAGGAKGEPARMKRLTLIFALAAACAGVHAQNQTWQPAEESIASLTNPMIPNLLKYSTFRADAAALRQELFSAPREVPTNPQLGVIMTMPMPDGSTQRFRIVESPIATPAIHAMTGVRTYAGKGIDDPYAYGRFDIGPSGFHGFILSPHGDVLIEPASWGNKVEHISFYKKDFVRTTGFNCYTKTSTMPKLNPFTGGTKDIVVMRPGSNRKEFRLALKGTVEYTSVCGGLTGANNNSMTVMNRVNGVYLVDIAIQMNIVNLVNYTAEPDPYTNNNGVTMLGQNQTTCDAVPGNANYDIGHVFSTGGGGVAGLGVVGVTGQKARGVTGSPSPFGDPFSIDYVAHEIGHQFGANHSFNGTTSSCGGGNRSAANAYEPGSGSTIMAYAGICGAENLQNNSDAYFHINSQLAIEALRNATAAGTVINTGNLSPVPNAGPDYTIPQDTPFRLTATATDGNGDALTYCWEQYDLGTAGPSINEATSPLFRSLNPSTSGTRWFPKSTTVINNVSDPWENLPSVNRTMNFRCTVRDNRAGGGNFDYDAVVITVSGSPFSVTSPNTAVTWNGNSTQTVTWNVGGGSVAANVRILLSTNGGASYYTGTATEILASTPNDGSQTITVPNVQSNQCRIIVEAVGNIFYDMSNTNFTINQAAVPPAITSLNPNNVNQGSSGQIVQVIGTNFDPASVVTFNGNSRTTGWVSSTQLNVLLTTSDFSVAGVYPVVVTGPTGNSAPANFTVNQVVATVNPSSMSVVAGQLLGGVVTDLHTSNNVYVALLCDENDSSGTLETTGTSPYASTTKVEMIFETKAARPDLSEFVDMYNYTTNSWENVNFRNSPLTDSSVTKTFTSSPGRFIQSGTRTMRVRFRFIPQGDVDAADGWSMSIDQQIWKVTP